MNSYTRELAPRDHAPENTKPKSARAPGEAFTRRLKLTGEPPQATEEAVTSRAYALYLSGPPCWEHRLCRAARGHAGSCIVPQSAREPTAEDFEVDEEDDDVDAE